MEFDALVARWHDIAGGGQDAALDVADVVADWQLRFRSMAAAHTALERAGAWVSGPADLLSIIGRGGDELTHSALVGWLLTPTARHGLGDRVLVAVLSALWPDLPMPVGPIRVRREVTGRSEETGDAAIADVVVDIGDATIVIENKVWASEGVRQCERIYQAWVSTARDVRLLFLTPHGRPPVTTETAEAAAAWRTLSYRRLATIIDGAIRATRSNSSVGRRTAESYRATMAVVFRLPTQEE
jgi:hypothetical protein